MATEWKTIPGYDHLEASDQGEIKDNGNIIRQSRMSHGYKRVRVGPGKRETVHKLVALAFLGPKPDGHEVRHLNGDRADNRAANLAYGTRAENIADTMAHGRVKKGETHHASRLTEEQVREIKMRALAGENQHELATLFGLGQDQVSRIKTGKRWAHVDGEFA